MEYGIDVAEFNRVVGEIMSEKLSEWAQSFTFVKINVEKNAELIKSTDHYNMLVESMKKTVEKNKGKMPEEFLYKGDDEEEKRVECIRKYTLNSAFPSYKRQISKSMLMGLISKFDKDGKPDKGFTNFVNSFMLNVKAYDYLYDSCPRFKEFSDNINEVATLNKFYEAREDKEYQKKLENAPMLQSLDKIANDPFFIDVCFLMTEAEMFHTRNQIKS